MDTVNVQQQGTNQLNTDMYVIVPRSNFSCNGRITGYMASLNQTNDQFEEYTNSRIVIWRLMNAEKTVYSIINEYRLRNIHINSMEDYHLSNVTLTE